MQYARFVALRKKGKPRFYGKKAVNTTLVRRADVPFGRWAGVAAFARRLPDLTNKSKS
jgi:hypothetical protein